jgi:hypothetical protein
MEEIWKDIPEYEGLYQVSNLGNIKSLPKEWFSGINTIRKHHGKIIKPVVNSSGYFILGLSKNKKRKMFMIHQLVAITFLNHKPDATKKLVVDHINTNKIDNSLGNLKIITHIQNLSKDKKFISKYTGVHLDKRNNKWISKIMINNKEKHLGSFDCELKAALVYENKLKEIL